MEQVLQNSLITAAVQLEKQLDNELSRLDSLGGEDLEKLREQRIKELKKQANQRQEWKNNVSTEMEIFVFLNLEYIFQIHRPGSRRVLRAGGREGVFRSEQKIRQHRVPLLPGLDAPLSDRRHAPQDSGRQAHRGQVLQSQRRKVPLPDATVEDQGHPQYSPDQGQQNEGLHRGLHRSGQLRRFQHRDAGVAHRTIRSD